MTTVAEQEKLTVFFDYTCPFAHRAHRWFDHLDTVNATWRCFSLLEHNYRGDGPPVWRLPERADDISLLLFAGHHWVLSQGADLDAYREAVFHAWHETDADLDASDVVAMATGAGATGDQETLRDHFLDAEADHEDSRALGVFGSPTLVFAPAAAAFVKLDTPPSATRARRVLDAVATMAELPSVAEVKRPTPPTAPEQTRIAARAS